MSHVSDLSNIYNNLAPIFDFDVNFFSSLNIIKNLKPTQLKGLKKTHYII